MANAKKSISMVPVFDSTGKNKIGTMNLVWKKVSKNGPDLDELDTTDDFNDLDTTHDTGSEYAPDVLDALIEKEENPPEYEENEDEESAASVVAVRCYLRMLDHLYYVGKYGDCTGFGEYEIEGETVFPYDSIAEPHVRTKAVITSNDLYARDEGSVRAMYGEQNNRRRQSCFTRRHYATVRGAQMAEDGFFVPRRQR